ncbi:MAG: hypothetical protein WCO55_01440 [Candidatus Falkowbacteria bacterium]
MLSEKSPTEEIVFTACINGSCCPTVSIDKNVPLDRQIIIHDDFGNAIAMSVLQFNVMSAKGLLAGLS